MTLNLLILTNYFAIDPEDISGGIGYRYVGLYGSLIKCLLERSSDSKIFWYSHQDTSLRTLDRTMCKRVRVSLLRAVMTVIRFQFSEDDSHLACIVGYPYAIPSINGLCEYFLGISLLNVLSLVGRAKLIVDYFDPPVECAYTFLEKSPPVREIAYYRTIDMFTLKLASFIIVVNEFYRQYVAKLYGLDRREIFVVSNGSLVRFVSYVPPKIEGPLTVLYAGAALKTKDIARLCQAITSLRNAGLDLELNIAGSKLMELPDYVRISSQSWPNFVEDVLLNSDVGVIPYPADKLYFSYTTPAKTFDYMAAGKPVISTNLFEVGKIIKTFECGLIAKGWDEFEVCLEKLYYDRAFAKKLGENGRQAAEKHFNYELLAKALLTNIIKMFES